MTSVQKPPLNWKMPLVIAIIVVMGIGLYVQRPREQAIQGKRLTQWLDDLDSTRPAEKREAAKKAIQEMGTNIVPSLLAMLRSAPSYSKRQMASSLNQTEYAHRRAVTGFQALGSFAVPVLEEYMLRGETADNAAHALSQIGREGFPPLLRALTNENALIRQKVEYGLEPVGPEGQAFVPALLRNLKDGDVLVRAYAARAVGKIAIEPEMSVPALIEALQDSNAEVKRMTAEALGRFGPKAQGAILPLLNVSKDKNPEVSRAAFAALTEIDPDAARKAGLK